MPRRWTVLLVEDDPDDVLQVQRTFGRIAEPVDLHVARDGNQAREYLAGTGAFSDRRKFPFPDLVLLDLRLPGIDGFEVLRSMRSQPEWENVAVVVLTSSDSLTDVEQAYKAGANSFLVKPADPEDLVYVLKYFTTYPPNESVREPDQGCNAVTTPWS